MKIAYSNIYKGKSEAKQNKTANIFGFRRKRTFSENNAI